ncbi:MAG: hypothetical protein J6K32_10355 [Clostridia bacterium]|nr:hypothetical protein [Clostridia bacterium]
MYTETMIRISASKKMAAFLKNEGFEYFKNDSKQLCITTDAYYYDEAHEVDSLILKLAQAIGKDCIIEGEYDYSEASGSSLPFRFEYQNGELKKYIATSWVSFIDADSYDDCDEFNECHDTMFTEDEFDDFCEEEHYLLEDGSNTAVTYDQIPMEEAALNIR